MRKKIYISLAGIIALFALVTVAQTVGLAWINLPGLVLVIGGTFLASVIGHSVKPVLDLLRRIPALFKDPEDTVRPPHEYRPFLQVAESYRRGDVRAAEKAALSIPDDFLRHGARLALDPHNGEELERMLQWRIRQQKERDNQDIRILRTMATFSPAFGMLGTLLGLVTLLSNLGQSSMEYIGVSMGFALMSTLYGLLMANLLFRPLALKLEDRSRSGLMRMNFLLDAIMMLYERQHPKLIGEYVHSVYPDSVASDEHTLASKSTNKVSVQRLRA